MPPAILITGAAKRIGAAIARRFAREGWHIVIHYGEHSDDAQALAASLPSAEGLHCDLANGAAAAAMVEQLAARLGDWRVLVNCAAVFRPDNASALDPAIFTEAMAVNAATPIRMAQAFLAHARSDTDRRVINLLDQKIANLNPDFFSYTLSKAALHTATTMLAMAHSGTVSRIYGLAPGLALPSHDQSQAEFDVSGRMNLLDRLNSPAEIADAAWFLAHGQLASGETLFVDSGQHLLPQNRDVMFAIRESSI